MHHTAKAAQLGPTWALSLMVQGRENQFLKKAFQLLQVVVHLFSFPRCQNACEDSLFQ